MATLTQLENQIQKLQRRADQLRERKSVEIIANIHALMQEHGLTIADLSKGAVGKRRGRPVGSKNAVKSASAGSSKSKPRPRVSRPCLGPDVERACKAAGMDQGCAGPKREAYF